MFVSCAAREVLKTPALCISKQALCFAFPPPLRSFPPSRSGRSATALARPPTASRPTELAAESRAGRGRQPLRRNVCAFLGIAFGRSDRFGFRLCAVIFGSWRGNRSKESRDVPLGTTGAGFITRAQASKTTAGPNPSPRAASSVAPTFWPDAISSARDIKQRTDTRQRPFERLALPTPPRSLLAASIGPLWPRH